jgi:threonine aldolase
MNFASDNAAAAAPEIMEALLRANHGASLGYGNDDLTRQVERKFSDLFERDVAVFLVATGTAANALALAQLAAPGSAVLCHAEAHIVTSEAGAPEFFGGGMKLVELPGEGCKISTATLDAALASREWGGPHHVDAAALSLTQATEAGTTYGAAELGALSEIAHRHGLKVHVDGARFANAMAATNASPADMTWRAGVDALSFGATKGGALGAEAVVFFDKQHAHAFGQRRKRGGHLLSKHRFLAAQFDAFLADGLWLRLACHANAMAARLARNLSAAGIAPTWPVDANLLFAVLPARVHERLQAAGASYYAMHNRALPASAKAMAGGVPVRLVTSFATTEAEVDRFATIAAEARSAA